MLESQLVMREEDFKRIQSVIEKLTRDANSKGVFVVDKAGQLIGEAGELQMTPAEIAAVTKRLAEAEKNLGNVEFVIGQASNAAQTTQLLDKAGPDAPVLAVSADIFGLSNFNREDAVMPAIFKQGRPVAVSRSRISTAPGRARGSAFRARNAGQSSSSRMRSAISNRNSHVIIALYFSAAPTFRVSLRSAASKRAKASSHSKGCR